MLKVMLHKNKHQKFGPREFRCCVAV